MIHLRLPPAAKLGIGAFAGLLLMTGALPVSASLVAAKVPAAKPATAPAAAGRDQRSDRRVELRAYLEASAQVLGLTDAQLKEQLRHKSMEQIASDQKHLTKDQFADRVATAMMPILDRDVDQHLLTKEEAAAFDSRVRHGDLPLWNDRHDRHRKAGGPAA